MKEEGIIIDIKNEFAFVKMQKHAACVGCNACKKGNSNNELIVEAENLINANVGDVVEVDLEAPNLLKAATIVYMMPLISLLLGVFIGSKYGGDLMSALLGVLFMSITFLIIKLKDSAMKNSKKFTPVIVSKVNKIN